jgi:hypothetical protein
MSNFRMSARIQATVVAATMPQCHNATIQTTNGFVSAILRRKVPINTLRMWALRFR